MICQRTEIHYPRLIPLGDTPPVFSSCVDARGLVALLHMCVYSTVPVGGVCSRTDHVAWDRRTADSEDIVAKTNLPGSKAKTPKWPTTENRPIPQYEIFFGRLPNHAAKVFSGHAYEY